MAAPLTDIERAFLALAEKREPLTKWWNYYDGNSPVVYSTKKLLEIFGKNITSAWRENWCAVVVDAPGERINLARFDIGGDEARSAQFAELWTQTQMNLDSDSVHLASLVCGEAFVIVGVDENNAMESYYNDPRNVWISYDAAHPKRKAYAAKWWVGADGRLRMTLYYQDRFEHYTGKKDAKSQEKGGPAEWEAPVIERNTWGVIPVFHFRRELRTIKSELLNAADCQDIINKLLADMMIGSEFSTIRQRYIIGDIDNAAALKSGVWIVPQSDKEGHPVEIGEFETSDLAAQLAAVDGIVAHMAAITRTPKHYFFKQAGDPSGEALIAMESPLVKKCKDYIDRFTVVWKEVAAFMLSLAGETVQTRDITPIFDDPETVQPRTRAEITQIRTQSGIPLETVLKQEEGWTQAQIDEMQKAQAEESAGKVKERTALAGASAAFFDRGAGL